MIINCENCNKKYIIKDALIPKNGKLLECGHCKNRWFFNPLNKSEINQNFDIEINKPEINDNNDLSNEENYKEIEINKNVRDEKNSNNVKIEKDYLKKAMNFFFIILISFIGLILIFDTFKFPISALLPGVIPMLDNLYISLNDFQLFILDLIN